MPIVSLREIVNRAFKAGFGVPAFNVVNDLTMGAVLQAAVKWESPVIVQTSVKTVRSVGEKLLFAMWEEMTRDLTVPVCLHLDHCPDRDVIRSCLRAGWNSVLFDGSHLAVQENLRQTAEVVREARERGADVEGEIEAITGVEDEVGSDAVAPLEPLEDALGFIRSTGITVFAPSIGNAHGQYKATPKLDMQRVSDIVAAEPIPLALHGGTGLSDEQFADLVRRGCAKVNISTGLKRTFMKANLKHLERARERDVWDPPALFRDVEASVIEMCGGYMERFGSAGRAW